MREDDEEKENDDDDDKYEDNDNFYTQKHCAKLDQVIHEVQAQW